MIIFAILFTLTISGAVSAADGQTRTTVYGVSGAQGQTVTLSANVEFDPWGGGPNYVPVPGARVEFFVDGNKVGEGWTDGSGRATCPYNIPFGYPIGNHQISARYTGVLPSSTGYGTLTVTAPNHNPVANPDSATTSEDTPLDINVRGNDNDVDGDPLTLTGVTQPSHGTTSIVGGNVRYTPSANYNGPDSFTYTISDGKGGTSTSTVSMTVIAVDDYPVANDDSASVNEDNTISNINSAANDVPSGDGGNVWSIVANPLHGTATMTTSGRYTYTPYANYFGTDFFIYQIMDADGDTDTGRVDITVNSVNDAPYAPDYSFTVDEDTPVSRTLVGTDIDSTTLSYSRLTGIGRGPYHGTVNINSDGTWTYIPDANYNGNDYFTYRVSDGSLTDEGRVTITFTPVNDAPEADDDSRTTLEDNDELINVLGNDDDVDGDPFIVGYTQPSHGTVTVGLFGWLLYTPDANYNGDDQFTYTISDGQYTSTATVYLNVLPVNDDPDADDDSVITNQNTPINIPVLANDTDVDGDSLSLIGWLLVEPDHGIATINADGTITYTPNLNYIGPDSFVYHIHDGHLGVDAATVHIIVNAIPNANVDTAITDEDTSVTINVLANDTDLDGDTLTVTGIGINPTNGNVIVNPDGTITYTPNPNYHGLDFFTYIISDGKGGTDEEAVLITVNSVNDVPTVPNYPVSTDEDTPVSGTVVGNDVDGDSLTYSQGTGPSHGSVTVNADGTWTYTPAPNYYGSDEFNVIVSDGNGGIATSTISITVNSVNDAPEASADPVTTDEDTPVSGGVTACDVDGDTLTYTVVSGPTHGTLTSFNTATGAYTYAPDANYYGPDQFDITVSDGNGGSITVTVYVTVNSVNDAPVAPDYARTIDEDTILNDTLFGTDVDIGDTLTYSVITGPAHGILVLGTDGIYSYTPNANWFGVDYFEYLITDALGLTDQGRVDITVNSVNDVPVTTDDSATTKEDTPVNIDVIANDSDVDGDSLSVTGVSDPAHGSVVINADGTVTYTPDADYYGDDSFTYTISDGNGGTTTGTVNITVERAVASVYVLTTVSKTNPTVGETITVTFKLGNKGPDPAENVVFTYRIPDGMEFVSMETQPGYPEPVYNPATRTITWTLGTVPVLDPWFKVNLKVLKAGTFNINPTVTTSTYDPTLGSSIQSVTVNAVNAVNAASTVEMQNTGIPMAGLILAILAVFVGLLAPKRK